MPDEQGKSATWAISNAPETEAVVAVLVVEDEVLIRLDIAEELRIAGFFVSEASSAEEALDLLASGLRVDVIFSDFRLLGPLDGWDLCEAVTQHYPQLTFILTSAQDPPAQVKAECLPFVPKPYQPTNVVELIARTTRKDLDGHGPT